MASLMHDKITSLNILFGLLIHFQYIGNGDQGQRFDRIRDGSALLNNKMHAKQFRIQKIPGIKRWWGDSLAQEHCVRTRDPAYLYRMRYHLCCSPSLPYLDPEIKEIHFISSFTEAWPQCSRDPSGNSYYAGNTVTTF